MVITIYNNKGFDTYTVKTNELSYMISATMCLISLEFYKQIGDNVIYDAVNKDGEPVTIMFTDNL